MADASAQHPAPPPATVADVMHPPVTTVEQNDHVAGAAYRMKRADATALVVTQAQTSEPVGIITEADISHLVADGKNPNDVRIYQLMTACPTVVSITTSIRDAAKVMTSGRFRHLPVMGGPGLVGIVDITDICHALLEVSEPAQEPPSDRLPADQSRRIASALRAHGHDDPVWFAGQRYVANSRIFPVRHAATPGVLRGTRAVLMHPAAQLITRAASSSQ